MGRQKESKVKIILFENNGNINQHMFQDLSNQYNISKQQAEAAQQSDPKRGVYPQNIFQNANLANLCKN